MLGCPAQLHAGGPMRVRLGFVVAVVPILLLVEAAAAGGSNGKGGGSPDSGIIVPLIGECPGTGGNCTMPDGCPGIKSCQDGMWVCIYKGTGSISCTACGQTGTRACTLSGPSSTCSVPITSQSCTNNCGTGT